LIEEDELCLRKESVVRIESVGCEVSNVCFV